MENGWKLALFLVLAAVVGVLLRRRFLTGEAPLRHWFDTRIAPLGGKLATAFCLLTLAAWITLWAVADPEERARLPREFQKVLESMEWGQKDKTDGADTEAAPPSDNTATPPAPPVHGATPEQRP
tara:strand:- start:1278 stop:1652 length:375 start_codon:yes stop_codon:yes gene_type:complete